jgi:hypothetical protein
MLKTDTRFEIRDASYKKKATTAKNFMSIICSHLASAPISHLVSRISHLVPYPLKLS